MKMKKKRMQYIRFLRYACLAAVPLIILAVLIAVQSRGWTEHILRQNTVDLLDKNVSLIDQDFSNLMINIHLLDSDPDLHELFAGANYSESNILSIKREIGNVCNRYFFDLNGIVSLFFYTPAYTFTYYDKLPLPHFNDQDFPAYQELLNSDGSVKWYPTYNLATALNLERYVGSKLQNYGVFSIGKRLNLTYYRYDVPYAFPAERVHPILFMNFSPQYFKSMLSTDFLISDTNYMVYDNQGSLIYQSLDSMPFSSLDLLAIPNGATQSGIDHQPYMIFQKKLSNGCNWTVAAIAPLRSAYSYFSDGLLYTAFAVLLLTVIYSVIMVILSTRSLAKPISILADAIEHTAEGDFQHRICTQKHPDYEDVFVAYNSMNGHISRLIRENYEIKLNEKNLEIQVINLQFNPHFLYNTLNLISLMTLSRGQTDISDMICSLSNMMRYSLKTPQGLVPFEDDMKYVRNYISLMRLRYDPPFGYVEDIDEDIMQTLVPKFMLQPFIENAILHGYEQGMEDFALQVSAKRLDQQTLCFSVRDNGLGMDEETLAQLWTRETDSIGIRNTQNRIQLYFGMEYGVEITSGKNNGTSVRVTLPASRPNEIDAVPENSVRP